MSRREAERILREVDYWHYPFELPWGRAEATKPGHNDRHTLRWNHFFKPVVEKYDGTFAGKRVLDLGCCQGFWAFEATRLGAAYCLGIDSSQSFITEAKALAALNEIDRCEFRRVNLEEEKTWTDLGEFHITLCLGLLYHLVDPIFVLRKAMASTLETLVVDTDIATDNKAVLEIIPRDPEEPTTRGSDMPSSLRVVPSKSALQELLSDGGFSTITFLDPSSETPGEYHIGRRISVIAIR